MKHLSTNNSVPLFSIPYNGKEDFVEMLLRSKSIRNVSEVYGSDNLWGSGRAITKSPIKFDHDIAMLIDHGISFNYLLNSISFVDYAIDLKKLLNHIEGLQAIGVHVMTVAHPVLASLIKKRFPQIEIDSSVNQFISTLTLCKQLANMGYDRITLDEDIIRDIRQISKLATGTHLPIKVLINNCCKNKCPNRLTHQNLLSSRDPRLSNKIRRDFIKKIKDDCISEINNSMLTFLQSNWVRPEDLARLSSAGVAVFKLSGRTYPTMAIINMLEIYSQEHWDGLVKDYLKPHGSYLGNLRFNYLFNRDVAYFFDHIWRDCDHLECNKCTEIANDLDKNVIFRMRSNNYPKPIEEQYLL